VSDELRRRFQDKMHGRGMPPRRAGSGASDALPSAPEPVGLRVGGLDHGPFPEAAPLNPRFRPNVPRVRLTLEVGNALCGSLRRLDVRARESLLDLCPGLAEHECALGKDSIQQLLWAGTGDGDPEDSLAAAHLIEHVALDLLGAISKAPGASGAACAYRGEARRCDVFVECADAPLGRAVALLSAAAVRDLAAGADRSLIHRHSRDLLAYLMRPGRKAATPEDVAVALRWDRSEARAALEALVRLGFVHRLAAPLTFSSPSGVLFLRAAP